MSDENEEIELIEEIIGRELLNEEKIEAQKIFLRDTISKNLEEEGYPDILADRISKIPEIISKFSGEIMSSIEIAERLEDEKAVNRLSDFLLIPIVKFIEEKSSTRLEKEIILEELVERLRELLDLDSNQDHKLDSSDSSNG